MKRIQTQSKSKVKLNILNFMSRNSGFQIKKKKKQNRYEEHVNIPVFNLTANSDVRISTSYPRFNLRDPSLMLQLYNLKSHNNIYCS